jgi:tRNA pseudouridine38-40 synthase
LKIAYDGTDFCGWQKQEPYAPEPAAERPADQRPSRVEVEASAWGRAEVLKVREGETRPRVALRTVQHVVEQAVRGVVREEVVLMGASRTDSGVHARGQVAAFTCGDEAGGTGWPSSRGVDRLIRALNGRLPEDVQIIDVAETHAHFDPIGECVGKGYSYTLHVSPGPPDGRGLRPLWDRRYVHHVWEKLDLSAMREAAAEFVGEHDFAAFAAAGHGRQSTIRRVMTCEVVELGDMEEGARVQIRVSGNGFLWNMVRIIAGTLVDVGRGRRSARDVRGALLSGKREEAGPTLPPTGLCLEWVKYAE